MVHGRGINGNTKVIALIGDPVAHSLTPVIQNLALKRLGVNVCNVAFRVTRSDLKSAVEGARAMGFLGLMVTIPHKESAYALADRSDPSAALTRSANLLVFRNPGGLVAYSTDGYAAIRSLQEAGFQSLGKTVTIVGAGGAARALALHLGADGVSRLHILNRTAERAEALAHDVCAHFPQVEVRAGSLTDRHLRDSVSESDLLINATSVGMDPQEAESPVPEEFLNPPLMVFDIVYNPVKTRLLKVAARRGCSVLDGVPMLVYTNEKALEHCLGTKVPDELVELMMRACYRALGTNPNQMMSRHKALRSGKTIGSD